MPAYTDQLGKTISLDAFPQRIVSLVPSQTELLYDLGLDNEVSGITKFCIHPPHWFQKKTRIGGTKTADIEKIKSLEPQLIIANKEENVQVQVNELSQYFPVWTSDVTCLADALDMIEKIGTICERIEKAMDIKNTIQYSFAHIPKAPILYNTAYLIWKDPYMTVGGDTFINDMLQRAGFDNIFFKEKRYPHITIEQLQASKCKLLLLSSEPYPFRQKHLDALKTQLPETKILLVDGELFSWYGSRLIHSANYFNQLRKEISGMV